MIKNIFLETNLWDEHYMIQEHDKLELKQYFTEEELKTVVLGSDASGAPSLDGFTFLFYQYFWFLAREDLMLLYTISILTILK
jgi:hypothetical protein